jgi:hypothetical protein
MIILGQRLGEPECPYLRRWAIGVGGYSIRLHHWYRSDDKRNPHDHPWWFLTLVLKGSYDDWSYPLVDGVPDLSIPYKVDPLRPGSIRFRPAHHAHSVAVAPGGCWTLMVTGKKSRRWGFWLRRADGSSRFKRSNKYFLEDGHHPCDQL